MSEILFDYDSARVTKMLDLLKTNTDTASKIYKKRFTAALRLIQDPAKSNLRTIGSPLGMRYKTRNLTKFVRLKVYFNNKPRWQGGMVSIGDDRKKGSKSYLLKFFELGTQDRYTRKRRIKKGNRQNKPVYSSSFYRGSLPASYFFDRARQRHEQDAVRVIDNIVDDVINSL